MLNKIILPIGTIIKLIESDSKVMITGYLMKNKNTGYIYDYCGCEYPIGVKNKESNLYFDKRDISKIIKIGYINQEFLLIEKRLKKEKKYESRKIFANR
ncbi:MAG: DUF4176 domain-containing protein [Bacilli bacterium]|nr:DUF4176 domain-containing protein [Bacilli bacterium]